MDALNYNSGSGGESESDEEFILEEEEAEIYEAMEDENDEGTPAVNDLEMIASYAEIPVFQVPTGNVASFAQVSDNVKIDTVMAEDIADSSTSDSDSSDDDEEDIVATKGKGSKAAFKSMLTEEEEENGPSGPLRTKNEIIETVLYPTEEVSIKVTSPNDLQKIGEVLYRIDHECVVVIQASYTNSPLNEGSVLCNQEGMVLGRIHEIFGPITTPFYIVRWSANKLANSNSSTEKGASGGAGGEGKGKKRGGGKNNAKKDAVDSIALGAETATTETSTSAGETDVAMVTGEENLGPTEPLDSAANAEVSPELTNDAVPTDVITTTPAPAAESDASTNNNRVTSLQQVNELFIPGTVVCVVRARSSYVTASSLAQGKGSDASNAHDEEPPEEELEYSDDEQELLARQARNRAKRGDKGAAARGQQQHNPYAGLPSDMIAAASSLLSDARTKTKTAVGEYGKAMRANKQNNSSNNNVSGVLNQYNQQQHNQQTQAQNLQAFNNVYNTTIRNNQAINSNHNGQQQQSNNIINSGNKRQFNNDNKNSGGSSGNNNSNSTAVSSSYNRATNSYTPPVIPVVPLSQIQQQIQQPQLQPPQYNMYQPQAAAYGPYGHIQQQQQQPMMYPPQQYQQQFAPQQQQQQMAYPPQQPSYSAPLPWAGFSATPANNPPFPSGQGPTLMPPLNPYGAPGSGQPEPQYRHTPIQQTLNSALFPVYQQPQQQQQAQQGVRGPNGQFNPQQR